jgi:hypothetical protein
MAASLNFSKAARDELLLAKIVGMMTSSKVLLAETEDYVILGMGNFQDG